MKRKLSLVLSLLMILVMTSATTLALAEEAGVTYPIETGEKIKLTYWVPLNASASKYITSYNENTAYQQFMEDTGIEIEFIHPASGQEKEQFNLLIASNDLPDMIAFANAYSGGEFQGMRDGMFVDLTDKLPELAPDYYKLIVEDEEFFREVSDEEGRIVAFCAYKPYGDPPFRRIILRNDILEEIGVEIPKTLDDYEEMFAKMLAAGITPYLPDKNIHGVEEQFAGMFGVLAGVENGTNLKFSKDENGKVQLGHIQPEFKQYLELMHDWYQKGYISKDFTSVDAQQSNTLLDTRAVGMIVGPVVANFNRTEPQGFTITSAPYPRLEEGQQLHYESTNIWPRQQGNSETTVVVSKDCKYVDEAIQFLNYGYTEAGAALLNWGVEGINWDWADGTRVYNDLMLNNEKFGTEEASYIYKVHFAPKFVEFDTVCHANLLKSPGSLASRFWWADDPNVDSIHQLPPFQLSADAQQRRAEIMTDVSTYCNEMVLKFIIGTEPLDNFDKYVETAISMGADEAIALTQEAYDIYMTKKMD